MRKISLTSLALLLLGVTLNSCSKNSNGGDDPNNPAGQSLSADYQHKIVFTTAKAIGEKISVDYDAPTLKERDNVWVDFNNNGIREEGEFSPRGGSIGIRVVSSQTITVYGKITGLYFDSDNDKITSIDTSKDIYLEELRVQDNSIETLDLTHNPNLKNLKVYYNSNAEGLKGGLKSLSISADKNPKLEELQLSVGGMKTLDISNFPKLETLWLDGSVEHLKITNNPNLDLSLNFGQREGELTMKIKNFEIHNNPKTESIALFADKIESIDVSDSPNLTDLIISLLDINNPALQKVKLLNTPKLKDFHIVGLGIEPFNLSFCVQADAQRVNNLPERWQEKTRYVKEFKQQTTINYQSTPCP